VTILNDILDLSKIEAGGLVLEHEPFAPRAVLDEVIDAFRARAAEKCLALQATCTVDVPGRLHGDAGRLRQVLVNLVGNAVKFTDAGSVSATMRRVDAGAGPRLCVEVRDTGIGIDPAAHHRLFLPFSQVDASSSRRHGGTGLGLAISRRLVTMMGGSIGVDSALDQGSCFRFEVPMHEAPDAASPPPPAAAAAWRSAPIAPAGATRPVVLVAEDNPVNQRVAARLLERLGCEVLLVANGAGAVDAVATQGVDLVLMDCQMPEMDGYAATAAIRAAGGAASRIPIVAVTANVMAGDRERCLAAGMDDHLAKPIDPARLGETVRRWLQARNHRPDSRTMTA